MYELRCRPLATVAILIDELPGLARITHRRSIAETSLYRDAFGPATTQFQAARSSTIFQTLSNVSLWPLCASLGSVGFQRIAAPLPDVSDQWVLIVQRHL